MLCGKLLKLSQQLIINVFLLVDSAIRLYASEIYTSIQATPVINANVGFKGGGPQRARPHGLGP